MFASLKAEFRKLLTVRSTYIITALAFALVTFYAFYIEGFKADAARLHNPGLLASEVTGAVMTVAIFGALVGVLLMAHEYRYSTIVYTLTSSGSRSRTLLAKILAVSAYALLFTLAVGVWSPTMTALGMHVKGVHAVHQVFNYGDLLWRHLLFGWGYAMLGLLLVVLMRNLTAVIASLFLIPSTVESLLGLLLKNNQVFLPFSSLAAILEKNPRLDYAHATLVFAAYLVGGWIIGWVLFLKRDAN